MLVESFMSEHFPEIKVYPLEGTYLQWLDMRKLGMTHIELRRMLEGAGLYLDNGEMFGTLGRGFQRINLACAKVTIEKAGSPPCEIGSSLALIGLCLTQYCMITIHVDGEAEESFCSQLAELFARHYDFT
jgi:phosphotransferase system HPr-like phosphotransfer protein